MCVDVATYRIRIGLFNSSRIKVPNFNQKNPLRWKFYIMFASMAIIVTLLLIGNVEANPGPTQHDDELQDLKIGVDKLSCKLEKFELFPQKVDLIVQKLDSIIADNTSQFNDMKKNLNDLYELNDKINLENKEIKDELFNLQKINRQADFRNRANNLIFYAIPEKPNERKIDSCYLVIEILEKYLGIQIEDVHIAYAQRIGKSSCRPILVHFNSCITKNIIMAKVSLLRGTEIRIDNDYSAEIRQERKHLITFLHDARRAGMRAYLQYDKLKIDGKTYDLNYLSKYGIPYNNSNRNQEKEQMSKIANRTLPEVNLGKPSIITDANDEISVNRELVPSCSKKTDTFLQQSTGNEHETRSRTISQIHYNKDITFHSAASTSRGLKDKSDGNSTNFDDSSACSIRSISPLPNNELQLSKPIQKGSQANYAKTLQKNINQRSDNFPPLHLSSPTKRMLRSRENLKKYSYQRNRPN